MTECLHIGVLYSERRFIWHFGSIFFSEQRLLGGTNAKGNPNQGIKSKKAAILEAASQAGQAARAGS